jgi:hypothetical protein
VHASSMTSAGRAGQTRGCAARDPWTFREGLDSDFGLDL